MIKLDLDSRYDHRLYTYDRINGYKCLVFQGVSPELKGNYQVALDSSLSRQQTIVLVQGDEWEIVLELRPRQFTPIERLRMQK
jgi:hypothetical protein